MQRWGRTMQHLKQALSEPLPPLETSIHALRGQKVILDSDLARVYGVETKRLNEQVKRNTERFPSDFAFQLTPQEVADNWSQIATSSSYRRGKTYRPYAFTEHGALMAAAVLNSPRAVQMSVFVVRAFVKMREIIAERMELEKRLDAVEKTLLGHDAALHDLYRKIRPLLLPPAIPPSKQIGFHVREKPPSYLCKAKKRRHKK